MSSRSVSDIFIAHLPEPLFAQALGLESLDELLRSGEKRARRRWPKVAIASDAFIRHVARHVATDEPLAGSLTRIRMPELFLACGCAAGDRAAIAEFESHFFGEIALAIERVGVAVDAADFRDAVREHLFVAGAGRRARIDEYAGRGDLRRWFRVAAVRLLLDWSRKLERETKLQVELVNQLPPVTDAELTPFKESYRREVEGALADAVQALSAEERNLLRFALRELGIDQLAGLYGTHRATVARKLASARQSLFDHFRRFVGKRLRLRQSSVDSLLRSFRPQIHGSLDRLLTSAQETKGRRPGASPPR